MTRLASCRVQSMGDRNQGNFRIKSTLPLTVASTRTHAHALPPPGWLARARLPYIHTRSASWPGYLLPPPPSPLPCYNNNQTRGQEGAPGKLDSSSEGQSRPPRNTCALRRRRAQEHKGAASRHGAVSVLREGAHEQGRVDQGGGPAPDRLHQGARRGVLALAAQGRGPPPLRQELQAALDELPPPGPQARQLHRRRRRDHHQAPRPARQQVVAHRGAAARPDGQRDQELLEHAHQAQAAEPRHRPADAPPAQRRQRRRGQRAHHVQHRRLPVPVAGAGAQARAPGHRHPAQCDVRAPGAAGGRPQQQRREHGRAAVPRPQPEPGPVRGPAVLAAQDAGGRRVDAHATEAAAADAADDHLPVLPPRCPQRRRLQLQDRCVAGGVPVSPAARGGPVHIGVVKITVGRQRQHPDNL